MACEKDAVALLTFSPPDAKAWLYDLIDANPATGIMLCRKHANATVVPMSWQLVDSRDPSWTPPGEPAAPQPQPAAIPGLLADETLLTEPFIEPAPAQLSTAQPQPAMATILSTTVQPREPQVRAQPAPQQPAAQQVSTIEYVPMVTAPPAASDPVAVTPTVPAPAAVAAMPASPMVGTAATAVVAPPMPEPHLDPPVARVQHRTETIRVEADPRDRTSHVVSLNEQIASHARTSEFYRNDARPQPEQARPQQQWAEAPVDPGPPAAADLVANIQQRLLPDPSLFELPLDTPAVTPHQGYR